MIEMKVAISEKSLARARYWTVLPWVVLAIGIPASFTLFTVVRNAVESVAQQQFERLASDSRHVIRARIDSYGEILYGLAALFTSQESVSRLQFHRYVESLDLKRRFPGFDVVNYAAHVLAKDKKRFEDAVRRDSSLEPGGYPAFAIKPPGDRPEYFVLVYVEPMRGFEFAFGLDTGVNPAAKDPQALAASINLTRDSGQLNSPGLPLRIKSRGKEYTGLGMRLGVYRSGTPLDTVEQRRAAFFGSVGAGFNVETLMKGVVNDETLRYLRFKLYGAETVAAGASLAPEKTRLLLYDSNQNATNPSVPDETENPKIAFVRVLPMEVGGRVWEVRFAARKDAIVSRVDAFLPLLVLAGGLLSSLLLFGMFYSLASSRSRAVTIANEITRDLRESEASLAEAQQMAHLGNWALDFESGTMVWSAETYRILGCDPQATTPTYVAFLDCIYRDDRAAVERTIRNAIEAGESSEVEHRIARGAREIRWVHTIIRPAQPGIRTPGAGTIMDITDRKLSEQKVVESQTLLNEAQKLSHLGCWQWNIADRQVLWSDELYRIFGLDAGKFTPTIDNHLQMVHPEDRATIERVLSAAATDGTEFSYEGRIIRPEGEIRHMLKHGNVVRDSGGRPSQILVASLDVTEQKRAGEALRTSAEQLQALSRRLVEVQESERRQFSRELHDRIGQNLTALSINLDILNTELSDHANARLRSRLNDSAVLLESTTSAIENVMSELRPPMLDDYGLLSALQWYANEFADRIGVDVKVHSNEPKERLATTSEIALFRIAQEALNNIAKHAHASSVEVKLLRSSTEFTMSVADNGVGFDVVSVTDAKRRPSLGMVTMRERTQAIGGTFEIVTAPGRGTRIVVRIAG